MHRKSTDSSSITITSRARSCLFVSASTLTRQACWPRGRCRKHQARQAGRPRSCVEWLPGPVFLVEVVGSGWVEAEEKTQSHMHTHPAASPSNMPVQAHPHTSSAGLAGTARGFGLPMNAVKRVVWRRHNRSTPPALLLMLLGQAQQPISRHKGVC